MLARKLISRKACRVTRSENATRPLVLVYRERCVRLYVIFIALEIIESEPISFPEPSLPLSSGTGKRRPLG